MQKEKSFYDGKREIPRGNTVAGVNAAIINFLLSLDIAPARQSFLDLPCGGGEFLQSVKDFFPSAEITGGDIQPPKSLDGSFINIDAQNFKAFQNDQKFYIATCISGVMEFDNTLNFFAEIKRMMDADGYFIVTNDNLLTVRDRLLYLLFGRTGQYPFFIDFSKPTWKVLTMQNLRRILWEAGFVIEEIRYAQPNAKEWLWLPLALPIYFFQLIYLRLAEKSADLHIKNAMLPFVSLFSKHYIFICRPQNSGAIIQELAN